MRKTPKQLQIPNHATTARSAQIGVRLCRNARHRSELLRRKPWRTQEEQRKVRGEVEREARTKIWSWPRRVEPTAVKGEDNIASTATGDALCGAAQKTSTCIVSGIHHTAGIRGIRWQRWLHESKFSWMPRHECSSSMPMMDDGWCPPQWMRMTISRKHHTALLSVGQPARNRCFYRMHTPWTDLYCSRLMYVFQDVVAGVCLIQTVLCCIQRISLWHVCIILCIVQELQLLYVWT